MVTVPVTEEDMARQKRRTASNGRSKKTPPHVETLSARRAAADVKAGAGSDRPTEEVAFYYNRLAFAYGKPR